MTTACFASVVSSNHFQYYIPTFIYTAKHAYPNIGVKIFVLGALKPEVSEILNKMREKQWCDINWQVFENKFTGVPKHRATCGALRYCIPPKYFEECDYVLVWDIDFLIFYHDPTHLSYFKRVCCANNLPAAFIRSAIRHPYRPEISKARWTGNFTRLIGGMACLDVKQWFPRTKEIRKYYLKRLIDGGRDGFDGHAAASYREYDEVMLYRICKAAGIPSPEKRRCFVDGTRFDPAYRDIHLGDFKFAKRRRKGLKKKIVDRQNAKNYLKLQRDAAWLEIRDAVSAHKNIATIFKHVDAHVKKMMK